eukprot:COSAG02_NODE_2003_length_10135_cov_9.873754_10_plen_184_part_00
MRSLRYRQVEMEEVETSLTMEAKVAVEKQQEERWTHRSVRYDLTMTVHSSAAAADTVSAVVPPSCVGHCCAFGRNLAHHACYLSCADDDADGWANFGDAADGSTGGDAFAAFEADPPLQPAPAPVPLVDGSASDGGSEINGTATAAAGADFEAAFEANFDDVESNELPAPPATDEKNDAEKEG